MRTIIAGTRDGCQYGHLVEALKKCGWVPTTVISGCARGADSIGEAWAIKHQVPVEKFPADWERFGQRAGYLRNLQMACRAQALIALWDGKSKGTEHMIDIALEKGIKVYVHRI